MKKVENILAICIEDIKAGRTTLDECLARYSSVREELEPLLRLALGIKEPPSFAPSADFRIRAKVRLMDYIHDSQRKGPWYSAVASVFGRGWRMGWLKTTSIALAVVVLLLASGTGTAYASQDSLPGDVLYPVKKATENVRRAFTFGNDRRVELELTFAGTRLEEMEALAVKNPQEIDSAVEGYENNMTLAVEKAESDGDTGEHRKRLEMVAIEASRHLSIIDGISDILPGEEDAYLRKASDKAVSAQLRALGALAVEDPLGALEINYHAMQNRLGRAGNAADEGETEEVEEALEQFQEMKNFGQEISEIARQSGHNTEDIDVLNEQAASEQAEIMKKVHGESSGGVTSPPESGSKGQGGHGQGQEGGEGNAPDDDIPASSGNITSNSGNTRKDPATSPDAPGMSDNHSNSGNNQGGSGKDKGNTDKDKE